MTQTNAPPQETPQKPATGFELSEDWIATFIGLILVLVIGMGLLGPGAQSVRVEAAAGQEVSATAPALNGWTIKVTLGGETVDVPDVSPNLEPGANMVYICREDNIIAGVMGNGTESPPVLLGKNGQISIINECTEPVNVSYTIGSVIPWPVFGWFAS